MSYYNASNIAAYFGELSRTRDLPKDALLFRQGQPVESIYYIERGRVKIETYTGDDEGLVLYTATEGMGLAEEHLFKETYDYTAIVEEDVRVRYIPKTTLLKLLDSNPAYATQFMKCIVMRYDELRILCNLLTIRRAEDRLLAYLKWKASAGETIDLHGRMGQLGEMLNLTRESIYRAMSSLEERGLLNRQNGLITVH